MAPFHRILLDAPCSNTGVMRRRVDVRWRLQPADFPRMQQRQLEMVRAVIPLLEPEGVLVYSTCSLEPEENSAIIQQFLANHPEFRLEQERSLVPVQDHVDGAYVARLVKTAP